MRAVRSKNTRAEMKIRRLLHRAGYRYRLHRPDLPGKPDIVFMSRKKAIFVHGCFWHGHDCRPKMKPTSNTHYWNPKIEGNKARDQEHICALEKQGWKVLVIWECEMKNNELLLAKVQEFIEN